MVQSLEICSIEPLHKKEGEILAEICPSRHWIFASSPLPLVALRKSKTTTPCHFLLAHNEFLKNIGLYRYIGWNIFLLDNRRQSGRKFMKAQKMWITATWKYSVFLLWHLYIRLLVVRYGNGPFGRFHESFTVLFCRCQKSSTSLYCLLFTYTILQRRSSTSTNWCLNRATDVERKKREKGASHH